MITTTPVTILAGFLGSGKSTILNALVKSGKLPPTAIIINEFGETAIDHALIEGVTEGISLLGAGCVCCAVRSDLEATMRDLAMKRMRGIIPPYEAMIVEMSGLAEPGPVLQTVTSQMMRQMGYVLGPVLATFDAVHGMDAIQHHHEARHQLAVADRIIITKSDLTDDLAPARAAAARINPRAPVTVAVSGDLDVQFVTGASRHSDGVSADTAHNHHDHGHGGTLSSTTVTFDAPLDWEEFQKRLRQLLRDHGAHILRLKGLLNLAGLDHPVALHAVHHTLYPLDRLQSWPDSDHRSRIVIIANNGAAQTIAKALELCVAS